MVGPTSGRRGQGRRHILRVLQVLAGLVVVVAVFLAWREARPFTSKLAPTSQHVAEYSDFESRPARFYELESRFARRARVETCIEAWSTLQSDPAMRGSGAVDRMRRGCLAVAERNVSIAPASSNDWTIAAILAKVGGDINAMSAFLRRSLATAPTEQWIADRRAILLFQMRDQIDDDLSAQIDTQLALLLRTEEGIKKMARLYLSDKAFRERIVTVAETVEPYYQRRFLAFVRMWAPEIRKSGQAGG